MTVSVLFLVNDYSSFSDINMEVVHVNLQLLPVEILNEIFSNLSPCFLQDTVRLVCKRFARILSDDAFWKLCYRRRYGLLPQGYKYPLLAHFGLHEGREREQRFRCGDDISWREITSRVDKREILWGTSCRISSRICAMPHSSVVDAIKILPNDGICVTGGRDKMMCLWNMDFKKNSLVLAKENAHNGWVWDIVFCHKDQFFSCGWDSTIKGWSLFNQLSCFKVMRTSSPPMCMDVVPGLLVAGLLTQEVTLFDPRVAVLHAIHRYTAHSRTVTSLKILGNYVYSVSEDKSLSIYDLRNLSVLGNHKLKLSSESAFPRKIAAYRDFLYVADSKGSFSIFNFHNRDFETPITCVKVGRDRPVNALIPSLEGVIAGTSDSGVKMVLPSEPSQLVRHLHVQGAEVTSMDFHKNYLVVSTTSTHSSVQFYTPHRSFYDYDDE